MPPAREPVESRTDARHPHWNEVLRALREARGVTQEGWAAQLGVSAKTVQRWERGERAPDGTDLQAAAATQVRATAAVRLGRA